ncbi:MAG TPA: hypothetical protein VF135_06490 [Terriglobales bacterium]
MKRYWNVVVCAIIVMAAASLASAQSLGEVAREERAKHKPQAAKVITNDDIPSVDTDQLNEDADTASPDAKDKEKDKQVSADDKLKQMDAWKAKIAAQDTKIKSLDREINLMEREHRLRQAVFYADAGTRIRDERAWADQERKYQADMAAKQKSLADEKAKLDDLKESARKSGVAGIE